MSAVALVRTTEQAVADRETVIWHDLSKLSDVATNPTGPLAWSPNSAFTTHSFRAGERNLCLAQAWRRAAPADRPAIAAAFGKAFLEQLERAVQEEAADDVELQS